MKPWRVWMVALLAGVIVIGHAYDICAQTEHWPFSFYSMYGRIQPRRKLSLYSLRAVVRKDGRNALVEVTPDYVPQISEVRLRNILLTAWTLSDLEHSEQNVIAIMRDFLKTYESRRARHLHDGQPIRELQFVRMSWKLADDGRTSKPLVETLIRVRSDGAVIQFAPRPATQSTQATQPTSQPTEEHDD